MPGLFLGVTNFQIRKVTAGKDRKRAEKESKDFDHSAGGKRIRRSNQVGVKQRPKAKDMQPVIVQKEFREEVHVFDHDHF